jgi:hypothetical protein
MTYRSTKYGRDKSATPAIVWVLLVIALALACAVSTTASWAAPDADQLGKSTPRPARTAQAPDAGFDPALLPPGHGMWSEIYAAAARLADSGSVAASRLALQMYRFGPAIYGMSFDASAQQVQRWQRQIACGSEPCVNQA